MLFRPDLNEISQKAVLKMTGKGSRHAEISLPARKSFHESTVYRHCFSHHAVAQRLFHNLFGVCHDQALIKRNLSGGLGNIKKLCF